MWFLIDSEYVTPYSGTSIPSLTTNSLHVLFSARTRTLHTQHNPNQLHQNARSDLHSWMECRCAFMNAQGQLPQRMYFGYLHILRVFKLSLYSDEIWGSHCSVVEITTPCGWVSGSRQLEGTCCLHLQRGRSDRVTTRHIPDDLNSYPYIVVSKYKSWKIWGSHSGPDEDGILLESFAVLTGKIVLLFASWHAEKRENVNHYSRKYHER